MPYSHIVYTINVWESETSTGRSSIKDLTPSRLGNVTSIYKI